MIFDISTEIKFYFLKKPCEKFTFMSHNLTHRPKYRKYLCDRSCVSMPKFADNALLYKNGENKR